MTERVRNPAGYQQQYDSKMPDYLSPRKTMFVLVIVVGCFAVLLPKVFYPMLVGSANEHMKPSSIDKTTGCCDVIYDTDVNTIKIMSELCSSIIQRANDTPITGKEIVSRCRAAVLETCGIDISAVLQDKVRLGHTVKQILDEVRSLNGSLCLKYNFGVAPWKLGVPHRVNFKSSTVRQERPQHIKDEMMHPAFRERGRAIPHLGEKPARSAPPPRIVEGRPGPIPGVRPPMGGAGKVVPPPQKGTSSMSVIMPIYTVGIVIFFTYTLMKLLFKKQPDGVGAGLYPSVEPDRNFRQDVFESEKSLYASRIAKEGASSKLVVNAMSALLDEVDQELELRRKANEIANQDSSLANGHVSNTSEPEQDQTSVKVVGMEMTASCEGGQKWSRPGSPVVPPAQQVPFEPPEPPQSIYLEGALPAQSQILVADSATEAQPNLDSSTEDPAVVLAGKMTLSVISLDSNEDAKDGVEIAGQNGQEDIDELLEESKYTTASCATAAENDVSEEAETNAEQVEKDEVIDVIEEIEYDDEIAEDKELDEKLENGNLEKDYVENLANGTEAQSENGASTNGEFEKIETEEVTDFIKEEDKKVEETLKTEESEPAKEEPETELKETPIETAQNKQLQEDASKLEETEKEEVELQSNEDGKIAQNEPKPSRLSESSENGLNENVTDQNEDEYEIEEIEVEVSDEDDVGVEEIEIEVDENGQETVINRNSVARRENGNISEE